MKASHHSRIYSVNEKFFDSWSPTMAYVLGFWFADGYMRREKSYRITFSSNDRQILKDILSVMKSTHPIRKNRNDNAHFISICSKKLYIALTDLGGFRRKSRTVSFPAIPKKFMRDFIRGYFDGDGSVFLQPYKATKNGKIYTDLRSNFTSGSIKFIKNTMKVLYDELRLAKKIIGKYNNGRSLKLGYGTKDTSKLLRYMYYENFPIGLQRKAEFVKFIK